MENLTKYITLREAGAISGYNPDYLSSLIRCGKIKGQKVGKSWVTTEVEVRKYMAQATGEMLPVDCDEPKYPSRVRIGFFAVTISLICAVVIGIVYTLIYQSGYTHALSTTVTSQKIVSSSLDDQPITISK